MCRFNHECMKYECCLFDSPFISTKRGLLYSLLLPDDGKCSRSTLWGEPCTLQFNQCGCERGTHCTRVDTTTRHLLPESMSRIVLPPGEYRCLKEDDKL